MDYFKKIWLVNFLLIALFKANAQDPQFSQFYSTYLYLAPSFAGLSDENRIAMNYRNQWPDIPNGFKTYAVSYDHYFSKFNSGLGVMLMRDEAGTGRLRTTNVGVQYSFDFRITEWLHMRPGMQVQYTERNLDFYKLLWKDQMAASGYAPVTAEVPSMDRVGDLDFATSLLTYSDDFWLGFTVDHLLKPNQSLYDFEGDEGNNGRIPIKWQVFGGGKYVAKQRLLQPIPSSIQLAFLYKKQDRFKQLDMGLYWYHRPLVFGIWYRGIPVIKNFYSNDALTFLIGYKVKSINIGYSYDFTISKLITRTKGSHELSLSYSFSTKPRKKKPKIVPCPDF